MTGVLLLVFWLASFLVVYPYLIYPVLLRLLATSWPARRTRDASSRAPRSATIIISAFNEEGVIARKLENVLALDYPAAQLQVIVSSDASSDRTDEIVRAVA